MAAMQDSHRLFLQSFMSDGILSSSKVKRLHQMACNRFGENYNEADLVPFVKTINHNIRPMSLEIKKIIREDNGSHFYGLVNKADTAITRLSSDYSPNELALFKKLLEKIVESETGTVSSIEAINLVDSLEHKMSKQESQALWERMEEDHWLVTSKTGKLFLSPRTILELSQYIQQQFPHLATKCNICNELCLQGQCCNTCDVKIHLHCAQRYFRDPTPQQCPGSNCHADWPHCLPQQEKNRGPHTSQHVDHTVSPKPGPSEGRLTRKRKQLYS